MTTSTKQPMPAKFARYLPPALVHVNVPAYIIGRDGLVRWLNDAARRTVGDVVGQPFTAVVDLDESQAHAIFSHNLATPGPHDSTFTLVRPDGERQRVDVSAVPLGEDGHAIGMFGLAIAQLPRAARRQHPQSPLTPRQQEILELLADGLSTVGIARQLVLSEDTVRNHVRHILQRLGARTRLDAVARARRAGLV